tara:strand:+ start:138 stop:341 length:204 start_codon:yes stop_codon:yes gene_type:complete
LDQVFGQTITTSGQKGMSAPIAMKELEEIGIFITAYYFKQLEHRKRSTSSITISHDNNANNTLGERV